MNGAVASAGTLDPVRAAGDRHTRCSLLLFFDPTLIAVDPPGDLTQRFWTVATSAAGDPTFVLAARGARRSFSIVIGAGVALVRIRACSRPHAPHAPAPQSRRFARIFVATVTHELKTPLSTIRAVGKTLVRGRIKTDDDLNRYAHLLVREERRLTRLVNNLLAYSRVTNVTEVYSFEALSLQPSSPKRDLHVPPPPQADLLVGSPLSTCSQASYAGLSLWHETTPTDWTPRPPLDGDVEADVAIVGAGYTGLWTAYYLARGRPDAADRGARGGGGRVRRLRAQRRLVLGAVPGLAASADGCGPRAALAQHAAMRASVDEVGRVAARRGHRLPLRQGRHHRLARSPAQ